MPKKVISWVELYSEYGGICYCEVPEEVIIKEQRERRDNLYDSFSDEEIIEDFIVIHWASRKPLSEWFKKQEERNARI